MEKSVFTFDSPRIQQFSLPSNIVFYLNQNPEYPKVLQKLQKTCKYFFARNKFLIIENGWFENSRWPKSSIINKQEDLSKCNAKLSFRGQLYFWSINLTTYKNLCSKIYYNNITLLSIYFTTLNLSDYKILTSSKSLKNVDIRYCRILKEEKNGVPLDEILKFTPNITNFRCINLKSVIKFPDRNNITNEILENIFANITEKSIDNFSITRFFLSPEFDPNLLCEFIKKAAAPKAIFRFSVYYHFDEQKDVVSTALFQMLKDWNIPEQKPQIILSYS
uniref:Uncharacterized protein n=1 Tax=Panagrolaimus davidi TaxID=227884 RepID=A0A914R397_9BILA